jgi:hypothetical protein
VTKDKKRKAEIRAAQASSGRRYTQLAREMAAAPTRTDRSFSLVELLTECATLPPAKVNWGWDSEWAPTVFDSQVLGGAVPYGCVLELAGLVAHEGRNARIRVESLSPLSSVIVVCNERRFQLIISQEQAYELCSTPGCPRSPAAWAFSRCDSHLADCDASNLVSIAGDWGVTRNEELNRDPSRLGGSPQADLIIKAAVANGAFERVSTTLLHMCFEDPDVIDEAFWDEKEALAMRHGLEREQLRLREVAKAEAIRIRTTVGACPTCTKPISNLRAWDPGTPPQFCSKACAPAPSAAAAPEEPWFDVSPAPLTEGRH